MQTPLVIQIEEKEWQELERIARERDVSEESLVMEAISEYLKKQD